MKKTILNAAIVILLFLALLSGILILWYTCQRSCEKNRVNSLKLQVFVQNEEQTELSDLLQGPQPITKDTVSDHLKALQLQNQDLAAWICIPGTQIDYPVMHTPASPQYYLRKDFDKNDSFAGLLFVQETCSLSPQSDNIIIHGHNMRDGTMFSGLHQYRDEIFWEEHKTVDFYTMAEKQTYEIIAVIETTINAKDVYEYTSFVDAGSKHDFDQFSTEVKRCSLYDTGIEIVFGDQILTLSTCSDKGSDSRFLVIARKA